LIEYALPAAQEGWNYLEIEAVSVPFSAPWMQGGFGRGRVVTADAVQEMKILKPQINQSAARSLPEFPGRGCQNAYVFAGGRQMRRPKVNQGCSRLLKVRFYLFHSTLPFWQ
jgi:hypothetical protein